MSDADGDEPRVAGSGGRPIRAALVAAVLLLTGATRLYLASALPESRDADESLVLLMADRIAAGRDLPIFHYGNAYLGSLDALLAAPLVALGGPVAVSARLVEVGLSLLLGWTTFLLGRRVGGFRSGLLAALFVALAPVLLVVWGGKLHLGYLDVLVIGNALFLLVLTGLEQERAGAAPWRWLAAGVLCGLGFWCHVLFLIWVATAGLVVGRRLLAGRRSVSARAALVAGGALVGGALLGAAPVVVHNLSRGGTLALLSAALPAGGSAGAAVASAAYNLVAVGVPTVLGGTLPWRPFRSEFALLLPAPLVRLAWALVALAAGAWLLARLRSPSWSRRAAPAGGALLVLGLVLAAAELLGGELGDLLAPPHPRYPFATLPLVRAELLAPPMLTWLLFVPLLWVLVCKLPGRGGVAPADGPAAATVGLLRLHVGVCCLAYLASSYGVMRSPRFLLPLYSAIPVLLVAAGRRLAARSAPVATVWAAGVLLVNLSGLLSFPPALALYPSHYVGRQPLPSSYGELAARLEREGVHAVYSAYWVGFPLVAASGEAISVSRGGGGRLGALDDAVAAADRAVFVMIAGRDDEATLRTVLADAGIAYRRRLIGSFAVLDEIDLARLRRSPAWRSVLGLLSFP